MYLGNIVAWFSCSAPFPIFAAILRVPFAAVAPMIVVSCAIGAYAIQNAMFDIWLDARLWCRRLCLQKDRNPACAFDAALVLGSRAEDAFRLSMIGSGGDIKVFWSNVWSFGYDAVDHSAVLAGDREGFRARKVVQGAAGRCVKYQPSGESNDVVLQHRGGWPLVKSSALSDPAQAPGRIIESLDDVTPTVVGAMAQAPNARLRELAEAFRPHMHAFRTRSEAHRGGVRYR